MALATQVSECQPNLINREFAADHPGTKQTEKETGCLEPLSVLLPHTVGA